MERDSPATVSLRPKASATQIRRGFPWVYSDDLVMDRRTRALAPGTVAELRDAERKPLALVCVNPESRVAARVLDRDPKARPDGAWLRRRLAAALALRDRLHRDPFYRMVHAEADGLPGLVIDRYGDAAAVQPNSAWAEANLGEIVAALRELTGARAVVKSAGSRSRALEGLDAQGGVLVGEIPPQGVCVPMNGATYMADLVGGQKTGLFYDQRPNHAFAARLAKGARVLDVFSHVGGFSLAALAAGADEALAVDSSAAALDLAREGAAHTGVADRLSTERGDAFEALAAQSGAFGLVVCDPPAFAPSRRVLETGLRAYERVARLAAARVEPGGYLVLCSCSYAAELAKFQAACARGVGRAGRRFSIIRTGFAGPDHPQHPQLGRTAYLKALFLRLD